jgi:uroporphyrinogen-III synthase
MRLHGLRILNTRPVAQAQSLNEAIQAAGGISITCPAIEIKASRTPWLNHLPPLSSLQQIIFISANAVNYFFEALAPKALIWPETITFIAIGQATAQSLAQWIQFPIHVPSIANSEHLLQLSSLQHIQGQNIVLVRGEKGREEIAQQLLYRGARLISLPVYRRVLPKLSQAMLSSLWHKDAVDIILFTSEQAMRQLFALFGKKAHAWLCNKPCVVISERLVKVARSLGLQHILLSPYDELLLSLEQYSTTLQKKGFFHAKKPSAGCDPC